MDGSSDPVGGGGRILPQSWSPTTAEGLPGSRPTRHTNDRSHRNRDPEAYHRVRTRTDERRAGASPLATYLDELLVGARRRVAEASARLPLEALRERAADLPSPPSFEKALSGEGVALIAEIKRASPSKGELAPGLDAPAQAQRYFDGGAAAISVLTEPDRFHGSLEDLAAVAALGGPALRKDFLVDAYQVWEARLAGASAVLLIVAALDESTLAALYEEAQRAGLATLIEIHDDAEAEAAVRLGAHVVGVNARDLRTFELDRDAFARLREQLPAGVLAVSESGVRDAADVRRAAAEGADAVLVGESLVTADDPTSAVATLVAAGRSEDRPDDPTTPLRSTPRPS